MHYTAITLDGLKILADTEKLYSSRIKRAIEHLTMLSDKWHSMISAAQNSKNVPDDKII